MFELIVALADGSTVEMREPAARDLLARLEALGDELSDCGCELRDELRAAFQLKASFTAAPNDQVDRTL